MNWEILLQNIGLSFEAAKIYISLLKNGNQSIVSLSKDTKIHRPQIYRNIPILREIGLVSEIVEGKRKLYTAQSPENLEKIFQSNKTHFEAGIQEMKKIFSKDPGETFLQTIEGEDFNFQVFDNLIKTVKKGEVVMRYSSRKLKLNEKKYEKFKNISDEKGIQNMIISGVQKDNKKIHNFNDELRIIPKDYDLFDDDISKVIYGNKVAFVDYNNEKAYIIENQKIAKFERKIFKLLFKYLKK